MDQQHRATFYASKVARSIYKPGVFVASGFLVDTFSEEPKGRTGPLLAQVGKSRAKRVTTVILLSLIHI